MEVRYFGKVQEIVPVPSLTDLQANSYDSFLDDLDSGDTEITNRIALLAALKTYFERRNLNADWEALDEVPDPVLVTTAAMGCPMKPEEKQLLLEAKTLVNRAECLQTILEMAIHSADITTARH